MAHLDGIDLELSPLCLGGNVFGWTADEQTSFAILDAFVEAGGNFIDTADAYSAWANGGTGGQSEEIIGKWMQSRGNRDQMVIATKVAKYKQRPGLSASNVRAACEDSLRRLQTDRVDLYYAHEDDPSVPLEETLTVFDDLIKDGMVRSLGASNFEADRLAKSMHVAADKSARGYVAIQPEYNLVERDYESALLPTVQEHGLVCFPYYALASGFLTGKYRPGRSVDSVRSGGAAQYLETHAGVLDVLDDVAAAHSTSVTAVSLAWLAAQPTVGAPIASARTVEQVADLVSFFDLKLGADEIERLNGAV